MYGRCWNNRKNKEFGSSDDDEFTGTNRADFYYGKGGNDHISGGGGNDRLFGGAGNDAVYGGSGRDYIHGGSGNDKLDGGRGSDVVKGGRGDDTLIYTPSEEYGCSWDKYSGGKGCDTLSLNLTYAEWCDPAVQADIARFLNFVERVTNDGAREANNCYVFCFRELNLSVSGVEKLEVMVDGVVVYPTEPTSSEAINDVIGTTQNALVSGDVSVNDMFETGAQFELLSGPSKGSVNFSNDGSFSFEPGLEFDALKAGESTSETFTYRLTNTDGQTSTATVTINIAGTNDRPIATAISAEVSEDDPPLVVDLLQTASDIDGDLLTIENVVQFSGPDVIFTVDGNLLTIDPSEFQTLDDGESETLQFNYLVSDGIDTTENTATIKILGRNDGPVAVDDTAGPVFENGAAIQGNVLTNDTDIDGDTLSVDNPGTYAGGYGELVLLGDGNYTYQVTATDLTADFRAVELFDISVSDGDLGATSQLSISIEGSNSKPEATAILRDTDQNAAPLTIGLLQTATDADGDALSVSGFTQMDGPTVSVDSNGSNVTIDTSGFLSLQVGQSEILTFEYQISDGRSSTTNTVQVTINGLNDAPIAVDDNAGPAFENGAAIQGNVLTNDTDIDGDTLSVDNPGTYGGGYGTLTLLDNGEYSYQVTASDLTDGFMAEETFDVVVSDGDLSSNSQLAISILGINGQPEASAIFRTTDENAPQVIIDLLSTASDPDGDSLSASNVVQKDGPPVLFSLSNGDLDIDTSGFQSLGDGDSRTVEFTYDISDGALQVNNIVEVVINGLNDAPDAKDDLFNITEGDNLIGNLLSDNGNGIDIDIDGDDLIVTQINETDITGGEVFDLPSGASITLNSDGTFTYDQQGVFEQLTNGQVGADSFTYTLSDGAETSTASVEIEIAGESPIFPAQFCFEYLADLNSPNPTPFRGAFFFGEASGDAVGDYISNAGDVNDDGFDDFLIGASNDTTTTSQKSYLVYGSANRFDGGVNLGASGTDFDGVRFNGSVSLGKSLAGVGDINDDGISDIILGSPWAPFNGLNSGGAHVVFGGQGLNGDVDLSTVGPADDDAVAGFRLAGQLTFNTTTYTRTGTTVSSAGDFNADGIDDLLIGTALTGSTSYDGQTTLLFGRNTLFDEEQIVAPAIEDNTKALHFRGPPSSNTGETATDLGDVNGDGIDDFAIGASSIFSNAGGAYVVFGGQDIANSATLLTDVGGGVSGVVIAGEQVSDAAGQEMHSLGDINGDGINDIMIGAAGYDREGGPDNGFSAGKAYIIYGGQAALTSTLDLSDVGGSIAGFTFTGRRNSDGLGSNFSGLGDINGDGYDDFAIAAQHASGSSNPRVAYVVLGGQQLSGEYQIADYGATFDAYLFKYQRDQGDGSISTAGDIDGDGFFDMIFGAPLAAQSSNLQPFENAVQAGRTYLIYGDDYRTEIDLRGGEVDDILVGSSANNIIVGAQGDDQLIGNGGLDALAGGAGNDLLSVSDSGFLRVDGGGGTDTLMVDGFDLDLTNLQNEKIRSIEKIDLTDGSQNSLKLTANDLFQISDDAAEFNGVSSVNFLIVNGDSGDTVQLAALDIGHPLSDADWAFTATQTELGVDYDLYDLSSDLVTYAQIAVQSDLDVVIS